MVHWGRPTTPAMARQHNLQLALLSPQAGARACTCLHGPVARRRGRLRLSRGCKGRWRISVRTGGD